MTIGVYGLGRFGSFWASQLSRRYDVVAATRSPSRETPAGVRRVELSALGSADAVFICVAISALEPALEQLVPHLAAHATVIDTCSVKLYPLEVMLRLVPEPLEVLGTHPMFGPDSARGGIVGLPLIITEGRASRKTYDAWYGRFAELGLRVVEMSADRHDHEAAFTQGVTHVIGRVLKELDLNESRIGTLGYRKILEVIEQTCNDPYQLFLDLQRFNPYTAEMRDRLMSSITKVLRDLSES